ncbi:MRN complex-interacting protein-like [Trifolium pratense]|nr:MRN complex-interacting protein-like [Trifolium pratense]
MASSSSTVFIALQCFHCSTMQVKQKKKSSNKWNCAVCNQKQSVRKVFAQGYKAKDIRTFVQSFNRSRKSLDDDQQWLQAGTLNHEMEHVDGESEFPNELNNNKSYAFNLYCHCNIEDDFEPLVVTEMPKDMFKKRKLVDNSTSRSARHFKSPLFRNAQAAGKPVKDQRRIALVSESNLERNDKVTTANPRTGKCKQTINSWKTLRSKSPMKFLPIEGNHNTRSLSLMEKFRRGTKLKSFPIERMKQVLSENSTFVKNLGVNHAENISALSIEMEET